MIQINVQEIRKKLPSNLQDKLKVLTDIEFEYLINEVLLISLEEQCSYLENNLKHS